MRLFSWLFGNIWVYLPKLGHYFHHPIPSGIGKTGTGFKFCEIKCLSFWFCFLSTSSGHVCLLPPEAAGNQFFPCQIPVTEVKGPFSHLSTPHFPSPSTHHSKAFAGVATRPHEYASFVHRKAQILCKELLLHHLAICEFFSSLDVCEKAETRRPDLNHL